MHVHNNIPAPCRDHVEVAHWCHYRPEYRTGFHRSIIVFFSLWSPPEKHQIKLAYIRSLKCVRSISSKNILLKHLSPWILNSYQLRTFPNPEEKWALKSKDSNTLVVKGSGNRTRNVAFRNYQFASIEVNFHGS